MSLFSGKPTPLPEGSFKVMLFVFILAAIFGGSLLWLWHSVESAGLTLYSF